MTVFVDADACPVKGIIVREAKRRQIAVTMLCDGAHVLHDGYSTVITVEKGRDSADFKLVTLCKAGDIVVTQDYGVAAMALGKGAKCCNQNGLYYKDSNIDALLYSRHEHGKARRHGHYTPIPKRTQADDDTFCAAFCRLLDETMPLQRENLS
ncbi:MAG: YaiI/YqxD family protein [Ruthenibacterium sp.]